jgi:hypothetical protein
MRVLYSDIRHHENLNEKVLDPGCGGDESWIEIHGPGVGDSLGDI